MYQTKRMVRWGDCDPAGIIYTPKAIDYALETIENWLIEEIGISWMDMRNKGKGLASVKFDCEYLSPMKAEIFINDSLKELMLIQTLNTSMSICGGFILKIITGSSIPLKSKMN